MKKIVLCCVVLGAMVFAGTGCESMSKENQGAIGGAVIGGAVGHNFGSGRGKMLSTFAGALLGAFAGAHIGRRLDAYDAQQAQHALEYNMDGQGSAWQNPNRGHQMSVTPTRTYGTYRPGGFCREFQTTIIVGGRQERGYGTACRQPDGSWKIVN